MKYKIYIILLIFTTSCGISEDCFKGNGNKVIQNYSFENFTKIKVFEGIGLVVKEGSNYGVSVETNSTIIDDLEFKLEGNMLVLKDNSTCNIARDYGQTKVFITIPDGTNLPLIQELELHSKTEQNIQSEGSIHCPIVRLFSIDEADGSGTGDFIIAIGNNGQLVIESNTVSNYFVTGFCEQMLLNFYFGNGRFYGENLEAQNINLFQRGSNDMIIKPIQKVEGTIYATGNVVLKNVPLEVNVLELFTGRLIY